MLYNKLYPKPGIFLEDKYLMCETKSHDIVYGDRKNEIDFTGKNMDEKLKTKELNICLSNELELKNENWETGCQDK